MLKIISVPISIIALVLFYGFLLIFHPIQIICLRVFGYQTHKESVDILNFFLLGCTMLLGTTYKLENFESIPNTKPLIFVANHQSMFDIVAMIWFLRKFDFKFVSKKELGKGVPSVSYNLKYGGSVLIDRANPRKAVADIKKFGHYLEVNKRSALIFPEGTRSKDGIPKKFYESGLRTLCENTPSATIVPITINNSWKFHKYGFFPFGLFMKIKYTFHEPLVVKDYQFDEIFEKTHQAIVNSVV